MYLWPEHCSSSRWVEEAGVIPRQVSYCYTTETLHLRLGIHIYEVVSFRIADVVWFLHLFEHFLIPCDLPATSFAAVWFQSSSEDTHLLMVTTFLL